MENETRMDESGELNRPVRELNEGREAEAPEAAAMVRPDQWLGALAGRGGSDLLLIAGAPPCVRVQVEVRNWSRARWMERMFR